LSHKALFLCASGQPHTPSQHSRDIYKPHHGTYDMLWITHFVPVNHISWAPQVTLLVSLLTYIL
jgi:hypothetical protein